MKEVSEIVERIRKKWTHYDFCATTLDDAWHDNMTERAREFLTEEDFDQMEVAVGGDENEYHNAINEATFAVLEGFVRYLAGQHDMDLVEPESSSPGERKHT